LAKVNLAEITNSNRTMTKERALQNGSVLFAQSTAASNLVSSTRLENLRADVLGSYKNGRLEVQITLSEGVDSGLRNFTKRSYQGAAELPLGSTRVISLRLITTKKTAAEKGRIEVRELPSAQLVSNLSIACGSCQKLGCRGGFSTSFLAVSSFLHRLSQAWNADWFCEEQVFSGLFTSLRRRFWVP
jgi:hypothetical protein